MSFALPHFSYKKIGQIADAFLTKHHPNLTLPIPIEEIAEAKLNLKIIPEANLKKEYDVDGFLTSDLSTIFIDFDLYLKYENRTRLTIAHEIGHLFLHGELFKKINIQSIDDLYNFALKITEDEYRWIEYQAYSFGSQVLIPQKLLFREIQKRIGKVPHFEAPEILAPIAQDLLEIFQVSGEAMLRRLEKENIVKSNS